MRSLLLGHLPDDGHAGPFYERLGFAHTGEEEDRKVVMHRDLGGVAE